MLAQNLSNFRWAVWRVLSLLVTHLIVTSQPLRLDRPQTEAARKRNWNLWPMTFFCPQMPEDTAFTQAEQPDKIVKKNLSVMCDMEGQIFVHLQQLLYGDSASHCQAGWVEWSVWLCKTHGNTALSVSRCHFSFMHNNNCLVPCMKCIHHTIGSGYAVCT